MIPPNAIDKALLRKARLYSLLPALLVALTFLIFPFSPPLSLAYLVALISSLYLLGLLAFKRQANFNCIRCGLCCALRVTPTERDIRRIEKGTGKGRELFLEKGRDGQMALKRVNGYCMFLKKEGQDNICSIYRHRPRICRRWPFHKRAVYWKWFALCPALRSLARGKKGASPAALAK